MIKAVLFDMDGLMIDSEVVTFHILRDILKQHGYTLTHDMYIKVLGKTKVTSIPIFKQMFGEDYDYWKFSKMLSPILNETLARDLPIKPGLIELLEYCKANGLKTCIATSSLRTKVDAILPEYLLSYFDYVVCGDEVKNGKPNPEVFLTCCDRLNVLPEDAIVLEDSEAGIEASHNGHIRVLCIPDMKEPSPWHKELLSGYFNTLHEVIPYLEKEK